MTAAQEVVAFFSTALILALSCKADLLPEPSGLTYKWVDPITLNLSWNWKEPKDRRSTFYFRTKILDECRREVSCQPKPQNKDKDCSHQICSPHQHAKFKCLLSEGRRGAWTASVQVFECDQCSHFDPMCNNKSQPVNIAIDTPMTAAPRDTLVNDFICLIEDKSTHCSWKPVNAAVALNVTYRSCNRLDLKVCDEPHSNSCVLEDDPLGGICMSLQTATAMSTFQVAFKVPVPKMNINESGGHLHLEFEPLKKVQTNCWVYTVHYKECNMKKHIEFDSNTELFMIPYNKRCRYDFEYSIHSKNMCTPDLTSISKGTASYGATPDWTLTVIAIVIPVILSACVLLSCFCFKKYREIIYPVLLDPPQIIKDLMNGNKDIKIPANVCETEAENFVPVEISPISEESVLQ